MRDRRWLWVSAALTVCILAAGIVMAQGDNRANTRAMSRNGLCNNVDMKPVLSLQQVKQADLVHYLVVLSGMDPPSSAGGGPEEFYNKEIQMLIDAGYPPVFAEIEPDHLVSRRFFASVMFQVAAETDPEFAGKYGALTDETEQMEALVESEYLYAEEGRIYREEILSTLCMHELLGPPEAGEPIVIQPEYPREGIIEPASPI